MNPHGANHYPHARRANPERRRPPERQADGHNDHAERRGHAGVGTHHRSIQANTPTTGERRGHMQAIPYLTREEIQDLSRSDAPVVIRCINTNEAGFLAAFKFEKFCTHPIMLKCLVRILNTLAKDANTQLSARVIAQVFSTTGDFSLFLLQLDLLIKKMVFQQSYHIKKDDIQCLSYLINVGMFGIQRVPKSILYTFPIQSIKSTVDQLSVSDTSLNDVKQKVNELDAYFASFREESMSKSTPGPEIEEPPEHYTEVSILPTSPQIHPTANKPFLRPNITSGRYQSWNHYLDVQFRLLREDFVGPLREGISKHCDIHSKLSGDIRVYHQVKVEQPVCLVSGVGFEIRFDPSQFRNVNWEYTNRLITGSLLCLSDDKFETVTFATVAQRKPEELKEGRTVIKFEHSIHNFSVDLHKVYIMVESMAYFEAYRHVLDRLQTLSENNEFDTLPFEAYIVQCSFSDVSRPLYLQCLPQPFFNLQEVLKVKKQRSRIALFDSSAWPDAEDTCFDHSQLEALKTSLTQDLSVIQGPPGTGKTFIGIKIVQAFLTNRELWDPRRLSPIVVVCYTNHALDQFLEGIQQISIGEKKAKITRIGGRSRSEHLNDCVLYNKIQKIKDERSLPKALHSENAQAWSYMKNRKELMIHNIKTIEHAGKQILDIASLKPIILDNHLLQLSVAVPQSEFVVEIWLGLAPLPWTEASHDINDAVLEEEESNVVQSEEAEESNDSDNEAQMIQDERLLEDYAVLFRMSRDRLLPQENSLNKGIDEWEVVKSNSKKKKRFIKKQLLQGLKTMSSEEANHVRDVWLLKMNDRWKLYRHWRDSYVQQITQELVRTSHNYNNACEELTRIRRKVESYVVHDSDVIGMTTTGAAKHNHILKAIHPRVVVVEEAAEIFEPHILTSLSSSVQQLVLIGDHKQLRPKPNYYVLDKKFGFSVSLFERLVKNNCPLVTLNIQHRMRPEIASLITPSIYPVLHNHRDVEQYESIQGVGKNLFFIHHSNPETSSKDDRSHSNSFEAYYITALCDYLLKQGYQPKEITILTTYRGQLLLIKQIMRRSKGNQGIRIAVVDDFQGEENEIILLSLVRSNSDGAIGFLNAENRVCVSLSRAKKGFYVIGNLTMLEDTKSTKWPEIISSLKLSKCIGEALPLVCQQHPARIVAARVPQDFLKCPEGGCQKKCVARLPCGHTCKRLCHPYDREHVKFQCFEKCVKLLPCGHQCTRKCYQCSESCLPCAIMVAKTLPICGHSQNAPCGASVFSIECSMHCSKTLKCGHHCQETCSKPCTRKCRVKVDNVLPCGHTKTVCCYQSTDHIECSNPCSSKLECEHPCPGTCGNCHTSRLHVKCIHPCGRTFLCGHLCDYPCTPACPPCMKPCTNFCVHSKCPKKCFEPCQPCMEPCDWSCVHYKCTQPCGKKCDRPPCNHPCMKRLGCGHLCIGLCGELCPEECRVCNKEEVCDIFLGEEDNPNARFILLPDCGHIIEVHGLDQWMEQTQSATPEDQSESISGSQINPKTCPRCKTPIRKCHRYGNQIKDYLHDIEEIKQKQIEALPPVNLVTEVKSVLQNVSQSANFPYVTEELMKLKRAIKKEESIVTTRESMFRFIFPHLVKAQLDILALVVKIMDILLGKPTPPISCTQDIGKVQRSLDGLKQFVSQQFISQEQINDAYTEGRRLLLLAKLIDFNCKAYTKRCTLASNEKEQVSFLILSLHESKSTRVTDSFESTVTYLLTALSSKYSVDGLTSDERIQIVKAIGLQQGHWFKCPNGHYYCIGECGGATETSKCPDCGSSIGGTNYQLVANNQLAPEIDGAPHAAWSEAANIL